MKLIPNARHVALHSWSSRLAIASSISGAAEMILPTFQDTIPRGIFAVLSLVLVGLVPIARVLLQDKLHAEESQGDCDGKQ